MTDHKGSRPRIDRTMIEPKKAASRRGATRLKRPAKAGIKVVATRLNVVRESVIYEAVLMGVGESAADIGLPLRLLGAPQRVLAPLLTQ